MVLSKEAELTVLLHISLQGTFGTGIQILVLYLENRLDIAPELTAGRELMGIIKLPEPKSTPIVHHIFQDEVCVVMAVAGIIQSLFLCIVFGKRAKLQRSLTIDSPKVGLVVGQSLNVPLEGEVLQQSLVNLGRNALQNLELLTADRGSPVVQHLLHALNLRLAGLFQFQSLFFRCISRDEYILDAAHGKHIFVWQQEVVNLIHRTLHCTLYLSILEVHLVEVNLMRCLGPPFVRQQFVFALYGYGMAYNILLVIDLQPGTNHGIAQSQTVGEERSLHVLVDYVQPQR